MDGGGKRQLPSWMVKSTATEQVSVSETNSEKKRGDSVETVTKVVKPRKKAQPKKDDTGIPSNESKSQELKEGQARTRKRKSSKLDKVDGERLEEDDSFSLKPCKESRSRKLSATHGENQGEGEAKVDGMARKRVRENVPRKKHSRKLEEVHNIREESGPSEDELTVEDLISIAKENVKADSEKFQKSMNLENEPVKKVKKSLPQAYSRIDSEKDLTSQMGTSLVTDQPLSSDSSLNNPLQSKGSINDQNTTFDPARDMLELFLGPWLKKS